jgi:hypothetical protein
MKSFIRFLLIAVGLMTGGFLSDSVLARAPVEIASGSVTFGYRLPNSPNWGLQDNTAMPWTSPSIPFKTGSFTKPPTTVLTTVSGLTMAPLDPQHAQMSVLVEPIMPASVKDFKVQVTKPSAPGTGPIYSITISWIAYR